MNINSLLTQSIIARASDLHLAVGLPPIIRVDGELQSLDLPALDEDTVSNMLIETMNDTQHKTFVDELEVDYAYTATEIARFRINAYQETRGPSAAFRTIPNKIVPLNELGASESFLSLCNKPHGLVLITGPAGSGKSTTLATLIDHINHHQRKHIITIEDPIEYLHQSDRCLISQREVGRDTKSFHNALRSAVREDPDIILLGEMRDLETVRLALNAAETGHLVFSTLHTNTAAETIDRIIHLFGSREQHLVRTLLANTLLSVISQQLLKKQGTNGGRVVAHEIMICTPAIRNLIRENKIPQIYSSIQTGQKEGMHTMEQYLKQIMQAGDIDQDTAKAFF